MTKRFYVEQKMQKIADDINELAKKQEDLSKKETAKEEQNKINKEFQDIAKRS